MIRRTWRRLLRIGRGDVEREVDDEIAFHLDMRAEELTARGLPPERARAEALRRFGDIEAAARRCREAAVRRERRVRRRERVGAAGQDLRFAFRTLRRTPGLTVAIVLTLALGIGGGTAVFSVVHGVLLRPLPYAEPERLVELRTGFPGLGQPHAHYSEPELADLAAVRSLAGVAAHRATYLAVGRPGEPERVPALFATADLARVLGVAPALGRFYGPDEDRPGSDGVAVLTDGFWRRRFGADPAAVGRQVSVNGVERTIVGVMPRGFGFQDADIIVPAAIDVADPGPRGAHYLDVVARLASGATLEGAEAELDALAARLRRDHSESYPEEMGFGLAAEPLLHAIVGRARPVLLILLGAVGLLLLAASANVATLLLLRAEGRRRELAIRSAMGAGRARIARQLLAESMLLAAAGGALGFLLAWAGVPSLVAVNPAGLPRPEDISVNGTVALVSLLLVVGTGLAFGLAPALAVSRPDAAALRDSGRAGDLRGRGSRNALVVAELAVAVVLLSGAALLVRSYRHLNAVNVGFDGEGVLAFDLSLPAARYPDSLQVVRTYDLLLDRLGGLSGVRSAAAVVLLPLTDRASNWDIELEGRPMRPGDMAPSPGVNTVSSAYHGTLGVPIQRGRGFAPSDGERSPPVAIVNRTMARAYWPGENAVGRRFRIRGDSLAPWVTVIGVAGDVKSWGIAAPTRAEFTLLHRQLPVLSGFAARSMTVLLRTGGDPMALAEPARRQVRALDPELAVSNPRTVRDVVRRALAQPRFTVLVLGAFAALALALATVGLYGLVAHGVARRGHELGVRLALGAAPAAVRRMVLWHALRLSLVGVGLGLALALHGERLLQGQLFGISPGDPGTHAAIVAFLVLASILAAWLPARRATAADPMVVLRSD